MERFHLRYSYSACVRAVGTLCCQTRFNWFSTENTLRRLLEMWNSNVMSYKWALTKNIVSNIVIKVCFSVLKCWTWHSKCSVVTNVCPALYKYSAINQFRIGHNFWHLNLIKALLSLVLWPELVSLTLSLHQSKFGDNWQLSFLPHSKVSNLFFASL